MKKKDSEMLLVMLTPKLTDSKVNSQLFKEKFLAFKALLIKFKLDVMVFKMNLMLSETN